MLCYIMHFPQRRLCPLLYIPHTSSAMVLSVSIQSLWVCLSEDMAFFIFNFKWKWILKRRMILLLSTTRRCCHMWLAKEGFSCSKALSWEYLIITGNQPVSSYIYSVFLLYLMFESFVRIWLVYMVIILQIILLKVWQVFLIWVLII